MLAPMTMADAARSAPERVASVLLPLPLPEAFDYAEPEGMALERRRPGGRAARARGMVRGVVTALRDGAGAQPAAEAGAGPAATTPPLPPGTLAFIEWAARYAVRRARASPWPSPCAAPRAPKPGPSAAGRRPARRPARADARPAQRVLEAAGRAPMRAGRAGRARPASRPAWSRALIDEGVLAGR